MHLENVDLYELIKAFENIIKYSKNNYLRLKNESNSIKDQMYLIEQKLTNKKRFLLNHYLNMKNLVLYSLYIYCFAK